MDVKKVSKEAKTPKEIKISKELMYKVILAGDGAVGKTSLIEKFITGKFEKDYRMTLGTNIFAKSLSVDGSSVKLIIWDLAGQPHFKHVRAGFYLGAAGALLVYDVTRRATLENLDNWRGEMAKNTGEISASVVVGNKCDLDNLREVKKGEGKAYADGINAPFFETSAKAGDNVESAFLALARCIVKCKGV
jgi:small GTP-binding protein